MTWWHWLLAVLAVALTIVMAVTLPSVVRYWKIRRM